jgi:Photosynthesis affected mutant 68
MARPPKPSAFGPKSPQPQQKNPKSPRTSQIPEVVSRRMARRVGLATGVPTLLGMVVFVASYFLVSRRLLDIPPVVTLGLSGGFFLLGLVGLSYGVLSASWEDAPGTLLGIEQISLNISRLKASLKSEGPGKN